MSSIATAAPFTYGLIAREEKIRENGRRLPALDDLDPDQFVTDLLMGNYPGFALVPICLWSWGPGCASAITHNGHRTDYNVGAYQLAPGGPDVFRMFRDMTVREAHALLELAA